MTEKEKILFAKSYLDKLANGINPLTGQPVPDTDVINQVKISRCLFYVSDLLWQMAESIGIPQNHGVAKKQPFQLDFADRQKFPFSDAPIPVSEIAKRINDLINPETTKKLSYRHIVDWLLEIGQLSLVTAPDGTSRKQPTPNGMELGITQEQRQGVRGTYTVILYNRDAQQFILDNLDGAIAQSRRSKKATADTELQGQPWTRPHEEALADLFRKGVPIPEIAVTLKRSDGSVRAKLKQLGLLHRGSRTSSEKEVPYGFDRLPGMQKPDL